MVTWLLIAILLSPLDLDTVRFEKSAWTWEECMVMRQQLFTSLPPHDMIPIGAICVHMIDSKDEPA